MLTNVKSSSLLSIVAAALLGFASTAQAGDASTALRNVALAAEHPTTAAVDAAEHCPDCRITTFQRSISLKGNFVRVEDVRRMECPHCRSPLANLFRIGKFKHSCDLAVAAADAHCRH